MRQLAHVGQKSIFACYRNELLRADFVFSRTRRGVEADAFEVVWLDAERCVEGELVEDEVEDGVRWGSSRKICACSETNLEPFFFGDRHCPTSEDSASCRP